MRSINIVFYLAERLFCLSTGVARFGAQSSSLTVSFASWTKHLEMKFHIGAKVLIEGNRSGTIRYFGPVSGKPGDWVGVELDFALGKHDGTAAGYFYLSFDHFLSLSSLLL